MAPLWRHGQAGRLTGRTHPAPPLCAKQQVQGASDVMTARHGDSCNRQRRGKRRCDMRKSAHKTSKRGGQEHAS
eukprot:3687219-Alexandrium_andersonii.AAC.1